jgi:hypothetical protein
MRVENEVVEAIVSAGPVSPMDEVFFPMSIEAITLSDEIDIINNEIEAEASDSSDDESDSA